MTSLPTKADLRRVAKQRRNRQEYHTVTSQQVTSRLLNLDAVREIHVVLCYVSFRSEVHTHDLINNWLSEGQTVGVPCCNGPDLEFYEVKSFAELSLGTWGILEPSADCRVSARQLSVSDADLIVVPGLAFTAQGNRLGYGGGYYDRALSQDETTLRVGIGFDCQILPQIPCQPTDQRMHKVVTESRVFHCAR